MFTIKYSRSFAVLFIAISVLALTFSTLGITTDAKAQSSLNNSASDNRAEPVKAAEALPMLQFTSGAHAIGFTSQGMYAVTGSHILHVDFVNANNSQPHTDNSLTINADSNVFAAQGRVAPLSRITYTELWDGVSLSYTANAGSIYATTWVLAPEAEAKNIRLRYNAPLTLNEKGTLNIAFTGGNLTESAPIAWQHINGEKVSVDVFFDVHGQEVTFALGAYNPRYALTIEPRLVWNTFQGGNGTDFTNAITLDESGNIYVTGGSYASWGNPVRTFTNGPDAFVAKLDSTGALVWNTFLGGSGIDNGYGIVNDTNGNIYVVGWSDATWGSPLRAYTGIYYDAFVAKLDSSGTVVWNTFLGGENSDEGNSIAVDKSGNAYVVGRSILSWGSPQRAIEPNTLGDAFAAKLDPSGNVIWNTFLGSNGADEAGGVALDRNGNVYVTGQSSAGWSCFHASCTVRAFQGLWDAFAAKLDSSGNLIWNTFLGGAGTEHGMMILIDQVGSVYITGFSTAAWGSPVRAYTSGWDAFVAKLNPSGKLVWHTFLGGNGSFDVGTDITMNDNGNFYVVGYSDFKWGNPTGDYSGGTDAFAAKLNASGVLTWNTFLGGVGDDHAAGVAVDRNENVYVAGDSSAAWGSPVQTYAGNWDGFVAKVSRKAPLIFNSVAAQDGWVLESNETSNRGGSLNTTASTFQLGDDASNRQYRTILSFDTTSLPDTAVIESAVLRINQSGLPATSNLFDTFGELWVDIRKGSFADKSALQLKDFNSVASATQVGAFDVTPNNDWYSVMLNAAGLSNINNNGLTQLRLYFVQDDNNNNQADLMQFWSGNSPSGKPQLIIRYTLP